MRLARIRADVPEGQRGYWITLSAMEERQEDGSIRARILTRSAQHGESVLGDWGKMAGGSSAELRRSAVEVIDALYGRGWDLQWWVDGRWE